MPSSVYFESTDGVFVRSAPETTWAAAAAQSSRPWSAVCALIMSYQGMEAEAHLRWRRRLLAAAAPSTHCQAGNQGPRRRKNACAGGGFDQAGRRRRVENAGDETGVADSAEGRGVARDHKVELRSAAGRRERRRKVSQGEARHVGHVGPRCRQDPTSASVTDTRTREPSTVATRAEVSSAWASVGHRGNRTVKLLRTI